MATSKAKKNSDEPAGAGYTVLEGILPFLGKLGLRPVNHIDNRIHVYDVDMIETLGRV
jgi:hypothetical protein